jgi:hypothetical protein
MFKCVESYKVRISYASSRTSADAPPPPLQTPATPTFPPFSLRTCYKETRTVRNKMMSQTMSLNSDKFRYLLYRPASSFLLEKHGTLLNKRDVNSQV